MSLIQKTFEFATAEETVLFGKNVGARLRAGDVVVLVGELGAGKTTLTRGIASGMGVTGRVSSPTFILARVHPPGMSGVGLVHVDAYRLAGDIEQLDDLDLERELDRSAIVMEWGEGLAHRLASDYSVIRLHRREDDVRVVKIEWRGATLVE
jgi:tRNA threonylcarbamoyladenosine biosynthesis protein TsaE